MKARARGRKGRLVASVKAQLLILLLLLLLPGIFSYSSTAQAAEEIRLKFDIDYDMLQPEHGDSKHGDSGVTLRPMVGIEQRFRYKGLVLLKVLAGLRSDVLSWLRLQSYYAHDDIFSVGHDTANMLVFDVIFHDSRGPLRVADRNGNEWHNEPGFYRYRNNLEFHLPTRYAWLGIWCGDEIRFDSDESRITMNDTKLGIALNLDAAIHLRIYYDLESNRRNKPGWQHTHVAQIALATHL